MRVKRIAQLTTKNGDICRELYKGFLPEERVWEIIEDMRSQSKKKKKKSKLLFTLYSILNHFSNIILNYVPNQISVDFSKFTKS